MLFSEEKKYDSNRWSCQISCMLTGNQQIICTCRLTLIQRCKTSSTSLWLVSKCNENVNAQKFRRKTLGDDNLLKVKLSESSVEEEDLHGRHQVCLSSDWSSEKKTVVLVQVMRVSCYDTYTIQVEPVMKLGRGGKHRTLSRSGASIRVLGGDLHYVAQVVQRMALMTM